jgi:hypothetical protein
VTTDLIHGWMRHSKRWVPAGRASSCRLSPAARNLGSPIGCAGGVPGGSAALRGGTTPAGDFVVLNPFLVRDLKAAGLWTRELAAELKARDGDLSELAAIPADLRDRYRTAFEIDPAVLIDAAARR